MFCQCSKCLRRPRIDDKTQRRQVCVFQHHFPPLTLHLQGKAKRQKTPATPRYNRVAEGRLQGAKVGSRDQEEVGRKDAFQEKEVVREALQQREVSQERVGRARQRPSSSPPREILRERRASSVQGRPLARQDLVNTSPRKGRGRDLSYHGAPLDSSLLLSARHLARNSEKPQRPRTSLSTAPPTQTVTNPRPVRRPTTASEKKSAAARNAATPAPPPASEKEETLPSFTSTKEPLALPAWTAQDLAGSEVTETSVQEDEVQEVSQPGRLQVSLTPLKLSKLNTLNISIGEPLWLP